MSSGCPPDRVAHPHRYPQRACEIEALALRTADFGIPVTSAGPLRTGLIRKGMIGSAAHGETAFALSVFDRYMFRAMPEWPAVG